MYLQTECFASACRTAHELRPIVLKVWWQQHLTMRHRSERRGKPKHTFRILLHKNIAEYRPFCKIGKISTCQCCLLGEYKEKKLLCEYYMKILKLQSSCLDTSSSDRKDEIVKRTITSAIMNQKFNTDLNQGRITAKCMRGNFFEASMLSEGFRREANDGRYSVYSCKFPVTKSYRSNLNLFVYFF